MVIYEQAIVGCKRISFVVGVPDSNREQITGIASAKQNLVRS